MEDEIEGIERFPLEIIITIFEYLPIVDIKSASVTCKKWLNAAMHSSVMDRRVLVLTNLDYLNDDDSEEYKRNLIKPILSYNSVKIDYGLHSDYNCVNFNLLRNIFECLNQFKNLSSLTISFYTEDEHGKCLYSANNFRDEPSVQLKSLKIFRIELYDGDNSTSCYLTYFLDIMPELVHLDIHLKLFWIKAEPCSCTRQRLYDYINEGKNRIRTLFLHADDETNQLIATIDGMNLQTMDMPEATSFSKFTDPNKLLHISLYEDVHTVGDRCYSVCDFFPNIETISVEQMMNMRGIQKLQRLKNLHGARIYDEAIQNLSVHGSNVLENLYLENQVLSSNKLLSFKKLLNLTQLTLCEIKITDVQMQEICENLKQLKHIALKGTFGDEFHLTDYGFTGEKEEGQIGFSISNLTQLKVLHIQIVDSCLGDPTLRHIMKIKGLEYLHISCKEESVKDHKATIAEFKSNCPFLINQVEITFYAESFGFYMQPNKKINKMFPLTNFMDINKSR